MGTILAIDPGNIKSGYVVVEHDEKEIVRVLEAGKRDNNELLPMLERKVFGCGCDVAIEMIVDLMPEKAQKVMEIMIAVIVVVILGFLFVQTIPYLKIFLESGRSTSMLHIPYIVVYGISLFSYVDMVISFIYSILHGVKSEAKEAAGSDE